MTPEEYIKAYTRGHSNELVHGGYHEWLTPENALAAVELAREEMRAKQVVAVKCEKKSPITGGEMQLMQEKSSVKFRGEEVSFVKKYYHCVDSGQDFTDTELDNDNMWAIFRAYWERKGFEHFYDIDGYRKEQEPASEDLEQAAEQAEQREGNLINGRFKAGFKSGTQWQREQMMKDAIEGYIVRTKIGELKFFSVMPVRYEDEDLGIADWLVYGACISCSFGFSKLFPMLLWENKPLKVKLTINK